MGKVDDRSEVFALRIDLAESSVARWRCIRRWDRVFKRWFIKGRWQRRCWTAASHSAVSTRCRSSTRDCKLGCGELIFLSPTWCRSRSKHTPYVIPAYAGIHGKNIKHASSVHRAQAINYLEAYDLDVGLLINFGGRSLEVKRLSNKKRRESLEARW